MIAFTPLSPTPTAPTDTATPTDAVATTTTIMPTATTMVSTAVTTTSIVRVSPTEQTYVVGAGDSLTTIAAMFDVTLEQLVNYNEFEGGTGHLLLPGDTILVPPGASLLPDQSVLATTTTSIP